MRAAALERVFAAWIAGIRAALPFTWGKPYVWYSSRTDHYHVRIDSRAGRAFLAAYKSMGHQQDVSCPGLRLGAVDSAYFSPHHSTSIWFFSRATAEAAMKRMLVDVARGHVDMLCKRFIEKALA